MPSLLVGNKSGGDLLCSGYGFFVSGAGIRPQGGVQLKWAPNASGNCYIALSGGMTQNSGQFYGSGATSGFMDGFLMGPGDSYYVPRIGDGPFSGTLSIFATCDAAASGQGRLYWEVF